MGPLEKKDRYRRIFNEKLHMKNFYDDESLEAALVGFVHARMSIER